MSQLHLTWPVTISASTWPVSVLPCVSSVPWLLVRRRWWTGGRTDTGFTTDGCDTGRSTVLCVSETFDWVTRDDTRVKRPTALAQHRQRSSCTSTVCDYQSINQFICRKKISHKHQWWKQDQKVKIKSPRLKTSEGTARMHSRKNSKNNLVKKCQKVMTSNVWHCCCIYCTKKTGACYILALSCHTASCRDAQQCLKQDHKYKTKSPRPRPRPVWDRSCKTAFSDRRMYDVSFSHKRHRKKQTNYIQQVDAAGSDVNKVH